MSNGLTCIKTGCHVYLPEYGQWVYGDLYWHVSKGLGVVRCSETRLGPIREVKHASCHGIMEWFDQYNDSIRVSTILFSNLTDYNYEGVPIDA